MRDMEYMRYTLREQRQVDHERTLGEILQRFVCSEPSERRVVYEEFEREYARRLPYLKGGTWERFQNWADNIRELYGWE